MTATKAKIEELMSIGVDIGKDVFHLSAEQLQDIGLTRADLF